MRRDGTLSTLAPDARPLILALLAMLALGFFASRGWTQEEEPPAQPPTAEQPADEPRPGQAEKSAQPRDDESIKTPDDVMMKHKGEFVRAEGNRFTMSYEGREHTHTLSEGASITLNGDPVELSDLRPGDRITVTSPKTELSTAVAITATRQRGVAQDANQDRRGQARQEQARQSDQARREQPLSDGPEDQANQERAALGVMLGESRGQGVLIRDVAPNGPAAQVGLRAGDYILSIDQQKVASPQELAQAIEQKNAGDQVALQVWRNNREMTVNATLIGQRELAFRQNQQSGQQEPFPGGQAQGRKGRQENQAWLGVMLRDERQQRRPDQAQEEQPQEGQQQERQRGAEIAQVYPSGPAARAGLRSGDVIVRIDEHEIGSLDELYQAMDRLEPKQQVTITVLRNGEEQELKATLGSRDDFFFGQADQFRGFRGDEFFGQMEEPFDRFQGMPEHAMMLEQHRHLATQHQRLEDLLNNVLEEVKQLRQEVQQLKGGEAPQPANP